VIQSGPEKVIMVDGQPWKANQNNRTLLLAERARTFNASQEDFIDNVKQFAYYPVATLTAHRGQWLRGIKGLKLLIVHRYYYTINPVSHRRIGSGIALSAPLPVAARQSHTHVASRWHAGVASSATSLRPNSASRLRGSAQVSPNADAAIGGPGASRAAFSATCHQARNFISRECNFKNTGSNRPASLLTSLNAEPCPAFYQDQLPKQDLQHEVH
jgi:hypothetical protein